MKKMKTIADQNARMHLIGRLWLIGGMLLICTIPLWLSLYYDVEPMWEVFGSAAVISPFILMALSGIAEPIVYSPMVGINGMYLSFLTGSREKFDLILLGPPYASGLLEKALETAAGIGILSENGIMVCESAAETALPALSMPYRKGKDYRYGKIKLTVYHRDA